MTDQIIYQHTQRGYQWTIAAGTIVLVASIITLISGELSSVGVAAMAVAGVIIGVVVLGASRMTVTVTGTAMVTWSFDDPSRHVVHELTWTRLSDGRQGTGSGDRTQRPLEEGLLTGFSVDGSRTWEGESGTWTLDIDGVEMRWVDAVPQRGSYTLTTPAAKMLSLSFERASATAIGVTITNGARSYDFEVVTLPAEE